MTDARPIVLAAGGTGGHMFPAEALARALKAQGRPVMLVTDRRGSQFGDRLAGVEIATIRSATWGRGPLGRMRTLAALGLGYLQARRILKRAKPATIVGFGGYPSVPTVMAGSRLNLPVVLHEQNAVLGQANRLLAGRATAIATSFPSVARIAERDRAKVAHIGNPVRPAILAVRHTPYAPPRTGEIHLLVTGGSQGAHVFSTLVPAAVGRLSPPLRARLCVSQQCRPEDLEAARRAYDDTGVKRVLAAFFDDMPERLAQCHLVIARAGASTVAELAAAGRPAILVPYPFAADDHQRHNAEAFAAAGAGWTFAQDALSAERLTAELEGLLADPERLARAAAAALAFGRIAADRQLAALALRLAGCPTGEVAP